MHAALTSPAVTLPKAVTQYLARHAEPVADCLTSIATAIPQGWQQAVVIPACREGDSFVRRLLDCELPCRTLFVLVLNGPADLSDAARASTLQGLTFLQQHTDLQWQDTHHWLQLFQRGKHAFLCINLLAPPAHWPAHTGVGYARKLGTDIALWLFAQGLLQSPWVRSTDADVQWPADYFQPLQGHHKTSAILYPFRHCAVQSDDASTCESAALYDAWLRYYVAGLRWSGSPWAFHTIGSTLAIHLHHYAMQRGFPKKDAGEDFYLLNKLAKSGRIETLQEPVLTLSNRLSDRTPFGTGMAINKIAQAGSGQWLFYHPDIFAQLKHWHNALPTLHDPEQTLAALSAQPVFDVLHALGLEDILRHCRRQCRTHAAFTHHLWLWFDAAMTRKCVHELRNRHYPGIDFCTLANRINAGDVAFLPSASALLTPADVSRWLTTQEQAHPPPDTGTTCNALFPLAFK